MSTQAVETAKYEAIWEHPDYGKWSPGEQYFDLFLELVNHWRGDVVDLGCGSGKASVRLHDAGFAVAGVDLVLSSDLPNAFHYGFLKAPLWSNGWHNQKKANWEVGYCTDVMEHIPTEYVMLTLHRISEGVERCFFSISNVPDHFGQAIGETLHLTVRPFLWWKRRIEESGGRILHARDLMTDSIFWVSYG